MISPPGCEHVSLLDAEFIRAVRVKPAYLELVERVCNAPPLRSSLWGVTRGQAPSNSINESNIQFAAKENARVGLSMALLEARLHEHRKSLHLFLEGEPLVRVTEHLLAFGMEFGGPLDLNAPVSSYLREALTERGRNRSRWFAYFTSDWRLRPPEELFFPDDSRSPAARKKMTELIGLTGASLCIKHHVHLYPALEFIEQHPTPVRREDLKTKFQLGTAQLDLLMLELRSIGTPNLAPGHRMKGSKNTH